MKSALSARWAARGIHARIACSILLLSFCVITPVSLIEFGFLTDPKSNDYFAFHSYSRFIQLYPPASIYNNDLLKDFQVQRLHGKSFPYFYHPGMLLLVWPLAHLPNGIGSMLWIGVGLVVYILAVGIAERNLAAVIATLVAPSTLYIAWCGQNTLLAAALLFGGFRLLPRQPLLAGVLFGLLTYKPQFGILVPVALLASGQWRAIAAACGTVILFVFVTATTFGWSVWISWLHDLSSMKQIMHDRMHEVAPVMATVTSDLMMFGVAPNHVSVIQSVTATMAITIVWMCFRRGTDMLGVAALAVATFLATPYACGYDMPVLTAAIIVIANERWRRNGTFWLVEILILTAGFLLPVFVIWPMLFRFSSLVILALLLLVLHRIWRRDAVPMKSTTPSAATLMA